MHKHGLDYLNARNILHGRQQISVKEFNQIVKKVSGTKSAQLAEIKLGRNVRRQRPVQKPRSSRGMYKDVKHYISDLRW